MANDEKPFQSIDEQLRWLNHPMSAPVPRNLEAMLLQLATVEADRVHRKSQWARAMVSLGVIGLLGVIIAGPVILLHAGQAPSFPQVWSVHLAIAMNRTLVWMALNGSFVLEWVFLGVGASLLCNRSFWTSLTKP